MDNNTIIKDLKEKLVSEYGLAIKDVILFGSRLRNDHRDYSDYDVLIIMNNEYTGRDFNRILEICYNVDLKYNILIDAHVLSVKELDSPRGRQPIYQNAIIYGMHA